MLTDNSRVDTQGNEGGAHPTRIRLIDAAVKYLTEHDSDELDVDAVLTAVGVTKGALYHHFDSVNELYVSALLQIYTSIVDQDIAAMSTLLDDCRSAAQLRERISMVSSMLNDPARRKNRLRRARILSLAPHNLNLASSLADEQTRLTSAFSDVLATAQQRGWFKPEFDPYALSVFIQAYALGRLIDDVASDNMDPDAWGHIVDCVIEVFLADA